MKKRNNKRMIIPLPSPPPLVKNRANTSDLFNSQVPNGYCVKLFREMTKKEIIPWIWHFGFFSEMVSIITSEKKFRYK